MEAQLTNDPMAKMGRTMGGYWLLVIGYWSLKAGKKAISPGMAMDKIRRDRRSE
jgi:hypothetical protein